MSTTISTKAVQEIVDCLKINRNRNSTRNNYYAIWTTFNEFFIKLDKKPRSWEDRLILFVGYLISRKRKSTTIRSYISAIKSVLRDGGVTINENSYLLSSLTRACRFTNDQVRIRLPIQKGLLNLILIKLAVLFPNQPYLLTMYRALLSTAYFGLFRVGELTSGDHPISAKDVHIAENKNKLKFVLHTSKTHWMDVKPQIIKINSLGASANYDGTSAVTNPRRGEELQYCPFELLRNYLHVRKKGFRTYTEPFFIFRDRLKVTPLHMRNVLKKALNLAGVDSTLYQTHSLRIGHCVDLHAQGVSMGTLK